MHPEGHGIERTAWLRAAVLGANDGIVSIASLVLGVAAADTSLSFIVTAGLAGLIGGALSMAAGEYVSVSSQLDTERADLEREKRELAHDPESELDELTGLLRVRGVPDDIVREVAVAMTERDALGAHANLELGIDVHSLSRPIQAAVVSAVSFAAGAAIPLLGIAVSPAASRLWITLAAALAVLTGLGMLSAHIGRAPLGRAVARILVGGAIAMGITALLGHLYGGAVA